MKLLKIEGTLGLYLDDKGQYTPVDKIVKDDLLRLANLTLSEEQVEFDEYDQNAIKNHAHQIVYKNVVQKLRDLRKRREQFIDESERLFLDDYEKYSKG